jgi:hypothetical protein
MSAVFFCPICGHPLDRPRPLRCEDELDPYYEADFYCATCCADGGLVLYGAIPAVAVPRPARGLNWLVAVMAALLVAFAALFTHAPPDGLPDGPADRDEQLIEIKAPLAAADSDVTVLGRVIGQLIAHGFTVRLDGAPITAEEARAMEDY